MGRLFREARLPLIPVIPAIVVVVGVATAIIVGFLGLAHLRVASDRAAATNAAVLASGLAARFRATSRDDHEEIARRAARLSGAEVIVCGMDGRPIVDASFGPPPPSQVVSHMAAEQGVTSTRLGRTYFSAKPLGFPFQGASVLVFVPAPEQPEGSRALTRAVVSLTVFLVGVAAIVALLFGLDLHHDVDFVRASIEAMAEPNASPMGTRIPVRVADQVGLLTHAFNVLVDRFAAAERAYVLDLDQVASMDRNRSTFLAALSHELRTPLNAILGFTDVLLSEVDGPLDPDTRENLEMVRASGSHLRGLIDDILELSAIESGQLRLSRTDIDIRAVAEDVLRESSARLGGKPVRLRLEGAKTAYAFADERRVWQILSNLVGNAIKFTQRGTVQIQVDSTSHYVTLSVSDTGPGIPAEAIESIFHEYSQLGTTRSTERGSGLGLFIVRRLVAMHGGTITAQSSPGRGSRFTVRIPVRTSAIEDSGMFTLSHLSASSPPRAPEGQS